MITADDTQIHLTLTDIIQYESKLSDFNRFIRYKVLNLDNIGIGSNHPEHQDTSVKNIMQQLSLIINMMLNLEHVSFLSNPDAPPEAVLELHQIVNKKNQHKVKKITLDTAFTQLHPALSQSKQTFKDKDFTYTAIVFYLDRWKQSERAITLFEIMADAYESFKEDEKQNILQKLESIFNVENRSRHLPFQVSIEIENHTVFNLYCDSILDKNKMHLVNGAQTINKRAKLLVEIITYLGKNKRIEVKPQDYIPRVIESLEKKDLLTPNLIKDLSHNFGLVRIELMHWKDKFPAGSIVIYFNHPENAPHHTTLIGKAIEAIQAFHPYPDANATHAGILNTIDEDETPPPGMTHARAIEILKGKRAENRGVERNWVVQFYKIKENYILNDSPLITSNDLMLKALEVSKQFVGVPYDASKLAEIAFTNPINKAHQESYINRLCSRFSIDVKQKTFKVDPEKHSVICAELVMLSYQIGWILLMGESIKGKTLPDFLNINAHCKVSQLTDFLKRSDIFEAVDLKATHDFMHSGTPHPNDPPKPQKHFGQDEITCVQSVVSFINTQATQQTATNAAKAKM